MSKPRVLSAKIIDVSCGERVTLIEPSNLYGCQLDDDVFVGPFVEIQKNTHIGRNTKVQSHTFICEYVDIGEDCFIGHGVMFANDLFKSGTPNADSDSWERITLGDKVTVGSNATIMASICSGSVIGAGSVVTKPILEKGIYAGNPARKLRSL